MATSNEKKDATSVAVAIIGIIGTLLGIVYFILASGNKDYNTLRLIEVVGLTLTNMGIVLVGAIAKNSKDTFSFPYLFGAITFLLYAYDYMNNFIQKSVSYIAKASYMHYMGYSLYYVIGCVAFVIGYLSITGRIKESLISIISFAVIGGGFFFNVVTTGLFSPVYRAYRSDDISIYGLGYSEAALLMLKFPAYITIFLGLIILQIKVDKDKIKKETEKEV